MASKFFRFARVVSILAVSLLSALALAKPAAGPKGGAASLFVDAISFVEIKGNGDDVKDPGESFRAVVTIRNGGGDNATGVSATISSPDSFVHIISPTSDYLDISGGGTANPSGALSFSTDPLASCGSPFTLNVTINGTGLPPVPEDFPYALGQYAVGNPTSPSSTDVPVAIPDNAPAGASAHIVFPTNFSTVHTIAVTFSITHPFDSDLTISLISPQGTTVVLASNIGGSGDNFTNTVLNDTVATLISAGSPPFTGTFKPQNPLSQFNNEPLDGTWTLKVVDSVGADSGTITAFTLGVLPNVPACLVYAEPTIPGVRPVLHVKIDTPSTVPVPGFISYSYAWSSDGGETPFVDGPSLSLEDTVYEILGTIHFDVGETWTVVVTPYYNAAVGTPFTGKFIITSNGIVFNGWMTN